MQHIYLLYGPEILVKILFFAGCSITIVVIIATLLMNDNPMD